MALAGTRYRFKTTNVNKSPEKHGVYVLYDDDELIYVGRAIGKGVTIRSRLQSHWRGDAGECTQNATHYRREATENAEAREKELLKEYEKKHGVLPRCNEKIA